MRNERARLSIAAGLSREAHGKSLGEYVFAQPGASLGAHGSHAVNESGRLLYRCQYAKIQGCGPLAQSVRAEDLARRSYTVVTAWSASNGLLKVS
jgi:hypothetical protein